MISFDTRSLTAAAEAAYGTSGSLALSLSRAINLLALCRHDGYRERGLRNLSGTDEAACSNSLPVCSLADLLLR